MFGDYCVEPFGPNLDQFPMVYIFVMSLSSEEEDMSLKCSARKDFQLKPNKVFGFPLIMG